MTVMRNILLRTFGRPQGALGRLGGIIMARMNEECGAWVTELLEIRPNESVLEVGFGPGVVIQRLSNLAGYVAGIDPSQEMFSKPAPGTRLRAERRSADPPLATSHQRTGGEGVGSWIPPCARAC